MQAGRPIDRGLNCVRECRCECRCRGRGTACLLSATVSTSHLPPFISSSFLVPPHPAPFLSVSVCICVWSATRLRARGISCLEHKTNAGVQNRISFLVGTQDPLLLLITVHRPRDGNSHGSGISRFTTASPKPSFWDLGGLTMSRPAEETLDGQHHRHR